MMKFGSFVFLTLTFFLGDVCAIAQVMNAQQQQAPFPAPCRGELQETNKALARRFYEQVWFSRNPSVVDEFFAPTYVAHDIGDRKGVTEPADEQNKIAEFFWQNGTMAGTIDYQIAEGDLVATRWQWEFHPTTWWMKALGGREQIPIINVFRFRDGKIVEVWNHRHDIDFAWGNILFVQGLLVGLIPSLILGIILFLLWRKLRNQRNAAKRRDVPA
jgi:predicted SnoaL-like aldol condensation-catalyzing enzyme